MNDPVVGVGLVLQPLFDAETRKADNTPPFQALNEIVEREYGIAAYVEDEEIATGATIAQAMMEGYLMGSLCRGRLCDKEPVSVASLRLDYQAKIMFAVVVSVTLTTVAWAGVFLLNR